MEYNYRFQQNRSCFYFQSFENDDNITLCVNRFTKRLMQTCQSDVEKLSPLGWKQSNKYDDLFTIWIPNDRVDYEVLDRVIEWAKLCDSCVWVHLNKNTEPYFDKDLLKFCICSDWNFSFDGQSGRTEIGEIEYLLKYRGGISNHDTDIMIQYLEKCLFCIAGYTDNVLVTTIPAIREKQNKPSWALAQCIAKMLNANFVTTTLLRDKPQMKSLDVAEKIETWRAIYADEAWIKVDVNENRLDGKTIIIVDDLYQSGASMWCYAEYLSSIGASKVLGISLVKSLKDSDNKRHG